MNYRLLDQPLRQAGFIEDPQHDLHGFCFGLLLTIFGCIRFKPDAIPTAVGLYITSAYWFTASTSFANPAVTIARALSNTFAGIAPEHVAAFIVAQIAGAMVATWLSARLFGEP